MDQEVVQPAAVVQRQLDAFNARDINALMATYANDAAQIEHPATVVASGADAIRARMIVRFQERNLHARILQRVVMGNRVIDHEVVSRTFPEGTGTLEVIATYEVLNGQIKTLTLTALKKTLDAQS